MGRLDLPDVHRDEDDFYGSLVDSPLMAREAGDSIVLRATGEPQYRTIVADPPWAVSPGPYLELFARERRPNWHAWGNEVESDVDLAA
jgi:hypothetical protein